MQKILKNLKKTDIFMLLACAGLIVLQVWLDLKLPNYMTEISTLLKTPNTTVSMIWEKGLIMILCSLCSALTAVCTGFLTSRTASAFAMRLRLNIFSTVESFSLEQIKKFSTASLITRTTNDVTHLQMFIILGLQVLIKAPVMASWAISDMSAKNWQCSIATAVAVAILITTISICISLTLPKFKKMQSLTDNINRVTRENLQGIRVVRAYNAERYEENKFEKANNELTKTSLFTSRIMNIMGPMMSFVMNGLTLAIYFIGSTIISKTPLSNRSATFGEIMGFTSFALLVVQSFMMLTMIFIILPRATVSAKRISEVLNTESNIKDGSFNEKTETTGQIEFKNVSFKYSDAEDYILHDISFNAKQGETIAFIGSTGSGKSTLINLIPRFYDITDGEILIDGINIKQYNLKCLRNKIGYISQKAIMFTGSIQDNLLFGDNNKSNLTEVEINEALSISCASNFVSRMENQKNSLVSQGGTNLSGGQKQRLSIARALARNPEFLIFDDSFSALDYKTDKKLRNNLSKKLSSTTKLIVAQRISTIKDADKIIVLNEGKLSGIGTHKELLKTCSVYHEIALSQFSKEEIENELR